jgi:hypothetical protein
MWEANAKGVVHGDKNMPSWSWLSVRGGIQGLKYHTSTNSMIELVNAEQQRDHGSSALPSKGLTLTVKGKLLHATLGKRSMTQESRHYIVAEPHSNEVFGEAFLDSRLPDGVDILEVVCLFVLSAVKDTEFHVLLLTPASENRGEGKEFVRLGMGVIWKESKTWDDPYNGSDILVRAKPDTVVLV